MGVLEVGHCQNVSGLLTKAASHMGGGPWVGGTSTETCATKYSGTIILQ